MPKLKRPLNPLPQRPPAWMDDPKLRAAFLGGLTDAAMQQRGYMGAERGEAEGLRRWELLRTERKEVRDWRETLEEQRRVRQAAADKLSQAKFAHTLAAPEREFQKAKRLAELDEEMEFEAQRKQRERQAEGAEAYHVFRERLYETKPGPDEPEGAKREWERRASTALRMYRDKHPWLELEKEPGVVVPKAPATKTIIGPDGLPHVMAFDPDTGQYSADVGVAGMAYQKPGEEPTDEQVRPVDVKRYMDLADKDMKAVLSMARFIDEDTGEIVTPENWQEEDQFVAAVWPLVERYYQLDPLLAEFVVVLAGRYLSDVNRDLLRAQYENLGGQARAPQAAPAAQQMPSPLPAPEAGVGPMGIRADIDVGTAQQAANIGPATARLVDLARKGNKKAQAHLRSLGVQW